MFRKGLILSALALLGLVGCSTMGDPWENEKGRKRVVVTIPALASFVHAVGGDDIAIRSLCVTTGPHGFKADSRDAAQLRRADLLLSIGLSLDDSFADALYALARNNKLPHIKIGQRIPKNMLMEMAHDHDHEHEGHHHHHGHYDPHIWLGIPEATAMVNVVAAELSVIDPEHAASYDKNAKAYTAKLKQLHEDGNKKLEGKKKPMRLITFHDSFGYFARSFGMRVEETMEVSPGDEPSPAHLAKIVKICKEKTIGALTVEPQYSEGSAKKVIDSLGGKIPLVIVDPLETADLSELKKDASQWYLKKMETNLNKLADALP
ncbi:MAG: zinc ABC transporter substrate-binding protein [Planctomycetia bacterium]|nr:zinc ABC transporter substrate-binding protein [Planctomycetia bacterium]